MGLSCLPPGQPLASVLAADQEAYSLASWASHGPWLLAPLSQGWWESWRLTAKVLGGDHSATRGAQSPKGPGKGHRKWVESGKISSFEAGHQGPQALARGTYSGRSQELGISVWIPLSSPSKKTGLRCGTCSEHRQMPGVCPTPPDWQGPSGSLPRLLSGDLAGRRLLLP